MKTHFDQFGSNPQADIPLMRAARERKAEHEKDRQQELLDSERMLARAFLLGLLMLILVAVGLLDLCM
jgi:hypothetical protein